MFRRRWFKAGAAALVAVVGLTTTACSTSESSETAPVATTVDVATVLGPNNPATGSPITIGFVGDGKSPAADTTPIADVFKATVHYANDHLGGINGHKIEIDECTTNFVPSDATNCGVQMVNDKVAAVLVPQSVEDATIFKAIDGSGIPFIMYGSGAQEVITGKDAFLFINPVAVLAGPAKIAKDAGLKKAGIIVYDVPSATGALKTIAQPIYKKAGVELTVIPISPQTPDMTPAIQQAMSTGIEQFMIAGTDSFDAQGIKALKQLGYTGKVVIVTAPTQSIVDGVPGGLEGVVYITSATGDANDRDMQLYNAIVRTYLKDATPGGQAATAWAFSLTLAFVHALEGNAQAVDATTIKAALRSMPKELPLPLGAGLTYRCGVNVVSFLPSVCTGNALWTTLDAQGNGDKYDQLDVGDYMSLS